MGVGYQFIEFRQEGIKRLLHRSVKRKSRCSRMSAAIMGRRDIGDIQRALRTEVAADNARFVLLQEQADLGALDRADAVDQAIAFVGRDATLNQVIGISVAIGHSSIGDCLDTAHHDRFKP